MEDERQKLIDKVWSDYCDLDSWIREMKQKSAVPSKYVLKMSMKHLRDNLYAVHKFLCQEEESERE